MSFVAPDEATASLLRLVAGYCGQPGLDVKVDAGASDVEFVAADGSKGSGAHTACRYIASQSSLAAQLLGESPEQQAKIAEWLSFRNTALRPLMDGPLAQLDAALAGRTYVAGGLRPSLADLALYAAAAPAAAAFPVAQHGHFCNLLRWYDLLHHTADAGRLFPAPSFTRPRYVAPPPPPPPEPKAAKGAAPDKGAAKADGKADSKGGAKGDGKGGAKGEGKGGAKGAAQPAQSSSGGGGAPADAAAPAAPADGGAKPDKKAKKAKAPATPAASGEPAAKAADEPTVDLLDIRVGQIVKVGRHPNADSLYLEEIDLGEAQPRQVVSGLVKFVPEEAMAGRRVLVVCNLKPAKMRDVMSYGMVLCASNAAHDVVDPILPPEGVPLGERVTFEGYGREPEAQLNPKKKQFEKIAPDLLVDASGVCVYRGVPMSTSKGPVTATIPNGTIS